MAQIQDATGNPVLANVVAGPSAFAALNDEALTILFGQAVAAVQIASLAGAITISFEGSIDGTNYQAVTGIRPADGTTGTSTTADGIWVFATGGYKRFRARVSAVAGGTANVMVIAGQGSVEAPFGGAVTVSGTPSVNLAQVAGSSTGLTGSGAAGAATQRVILATDQTVIPVSDNGGSLTVDGSVSITGTATVDTELPAAAALADAAANPTAPAVDSRPSVYNGATWDRLRGDTTNGADVDVTRVGPGYQQTGSGSLTALNQAVTIALQGEANVAFQLTGTWVGTVIFEATVDGTNWGSIYAYQAGDNVITIAGVTTNDSYRCTVAGFHSVRARCSAYTSGTIVVTARSTNQTSGVFQNFPPTCGPNPQAPLSSNVTASGNTTLVAAPGAGLSIYVNKGVIVNRAATNRLVALTDGAGGTVRLRGEARQEGGGFGFDFGNRGWKLTANTALVANLDAAGDLDVNITEYYIAP